jgi:hypothetical protein
MAQSVTGTTEEVIAELPVAFDELKDGKFKVLASGLAKVSAGATATFRIRLGGAVGTPDGTSLASFTSNAAAFTPAFGGAAAIDKPTGGGPTLLKLTAVCDKADGVCVFRSKTVTVRGDA